MVIDESDIGGSSRDSIPGSDHAVVGIAQYDIAIVWSSIVRTARIWIHRHKPIKMFYKLDWTT